MAGHDPRLTGVLRFPWFGAPRTPKLAGIAVVVAFGMLPWVFAKPADVMFFTLSVWGMAALGFFDGVTEVDSRRREVRRVLRVLFCVPLWSWRIPVEAGAEVRLRFTPPPADDENRAVSAVLELSVPGGRTFQLAQASGSPFDPGDYLAATAERVREALRLPLEHEVDGAGAGANPAPAPIRPFPLRALVVFWSCAIVVLAFLSARRHRRRSSRASPAT